MFIEGIMGRVQECEDVFSYLAAWTAVSWTPWLSLVAFYNAKLKLKIWCIIYTWDKWQRWKKTSHLLVLLLQERCFAKKWNIMESHESGIVLWHTLVTSTVCDIRSYTMISNRYILKSLVRLEIVNTVAHSSVHQTKAIWIPWRVHILAEPSPKLLLYVKLTCRKESNESTAKNSEGRLMTGKCHQDNAETYILTCTNVVLWCNSQQAGRAGQHSTR